MKKLKKTLITALLVGSMVFSSVIFGSCGKDKTVQLDSLGFNDVELKNYTIVYNCDDNLSLYCAENLADAIYENLGITLEVMPDSEDETPNEILIGMTSRKQSKAFAGVTIQNDEYVLSGVDGKLVMYANDYMVGGAANHLVQELIKAKGADQNANLKIEQNSQPYTYEFIAPTSAVLMIGDGMGFNHIEYAKEKGKINEFYASKMPVRGRLKTYSYSVYAGQAQFTDSAAAATALSTGFKTFNNYVGVDHEGNTLKNVRELAYEKGAKTAVLTTDAITGATPSGFLAHTLSRGSIDELQSQITALLDEGKVERAQGDLGDGLIDAVKETLKTVSAGGSKFFVMIEEGLIDKYAHVQDLNNMGYALARYNEVAAYVMQFSLMHPGTALVVTADHETGGLTKLDGQYKYLSNNHTNENVPIFAMGLNAKDIVKNGGDNILVAKYLASVFSSEPFGGESLM